MLTQRKKSATSHLLNSYAFFTPKSPLPSVDLYSSKLSPSLFLLWFLSSVDLHISHQKPATLSSRHEAFILQTWNCYPLQVLLCFLSMKSSSPPLSIYLPSSSCRFPPFQLLLLASITSFPSPFSGAVIPPVLHITHTQRDTFPCKSMQ